MKNTYETPIVEIIEIKDEDILTSSSLGGIQAGDNEIDIDDLFS